MITYGHRLWPRLIEGTTKSWEGSKSAICRHVGYVGPCQLPWGNGSSCTSLLGMYIAFLCFVIGLRLFFHF
jgi:hypothetical protein